MYSSLSAVGAEIYNQFKLDLDEYTIRTNSIDALNQMGLIETRTVLFRASIKDYKVKFPQNIGAITRFNWVIANRPFPQSSSVTVTLQNIYFPPQTVWTPIPNSDIALVESVDEQQFNIPPNVKGPYISYKWSPPYLSFNETGIDIVASAEQIVTDENGDILIPEDAVKACAYNCAEVYYRPLYILGKIPSNVYKDIINWTDKEFARCQNTIGFKQLDQQAMSNIHSQGASFDRKSYGIDS